MITIINYGLGNINAFVNLYKRINIDIKVASDEESLIRATKIILPGVGAFDHAMTQLNKSGMREMLEELVFNRKIPVLGICVGMQILANSSDEGLLPGLGWIKGKVKIFEKASIPYKTKLPHMGWNEVKPHNANRLFNGLENESRYYFLHSYYFECMNNEDVISTTEYGITYASAVNKNNIFGVQFHPEKSHINGIRLLKNFAEI